MTLLPWWPVWGDSAVLYVGTLLAWTMGLYVALRGGLKRLPVLTMLAVLSLVVWFVGQALAALAPTAADWLVWVRGTWRAASLAPAFWVLVAVTLLADEGAESAQARLRRAYPAVVAAILLAGGLFAVLGTVGESVVRWSESARPERPIQFGTGSVLWHVPPGPLFPWYQAYLVGCLAAATAILAGLWLNSPPRTPLRARFFWLAASAGLFLVGGGYITAASGLFGFTALPGEIALIAGLLTMGWNLARYGALLEGEVVAADFLAFALSMVALAALYVGLFLWLAPAGSFDWLERGMPLLLVLLTTHALMDARARLLDRVLYGPGLRAIRERLRHLDYRVARQADPVAALAEVREVVDALVREQGAGIQGEPLANAGVDAPVATTPAAGNAAVPPAELRLLVEGALRRLNDLPALSQHPLLAALPQAGGASGTPLERATVLRADLERAIERLRPPGQRPTGGSSTGPGGWLHYLVLHEAYVEGRPNKQIMQRHYLSEGTFHRARRRAIDAITLDLYQGNLDAAAPAV